MDTMTTSELDEIRLKSFFDKAQIAELPDTFDLTPKNVWSFFCAAMSDGHSQIEIEKTIQQLRDRVAPGRYLIDYTSEDWQNFVNIIRKLGE